MELLKAAIEAGWQARALEVAVFELRAGRFSSASVSDTITWQTNITTRESPAFCK